MGVAVHLDFQQWHRSTRECREESRTFWADLDDFLCCCGLQGVCLGLFSLGAVRLIILFPEKQTTDYVNDHSVIVRPPRRARDQRISSRTRVSLGSRFSRVAERGPAGLVTSILFSLDFTPQFTSPKSIKILKHRISSLSSAIPTNHSAHLDSYLAPTARPLALFAF